MTEGAATNWCPPGLPAGRPVDLAGRGTTWVHEQDGPPDAPTLVLLHGWTATGALNWSKCIAALGRDHRVVVIDHRGHGRGIRSPDRFQLEDCADDAVALADELGIDRFIPVGYSMGGAVAQLIWHRHPDRVDGLVLCATSGEFADRRRERIMFGALDGLAAAARVTPPAVRAAVADRLFGRRYSNDTAFGRWARSEVSRNDPQAVIEAGHALGRFRSHGWIGGVDVPAAVVLTEQDSVVRPDRQRRLAAAVPGATVHLVTGDHDVCAAAPDRFVPALVDACRRVTERTSPPGPAPD